MAEGSIFTRTRPGLPAADLQFHFGPVFFVDHGFTTHERHAFSLVPILVTPKSRGHVRLKSADPLEYPAILGNHLTEPEDVATLVAGVRLAAGSPPPSRSPRPPGPRSSPVPRSTTTTRRSRPTSAGASSSPTTRSAPAGWATDDDAVVDPQLRVRGVDGLRVADASVMPLIPGGNTHASTVMIGEKASDLIRAG